MFVYNVQYMLFHHSVSLPKIIVAMILKERFNMPLGNLHFIVQIRKLASNHLISDRVFDSETENWYSPYVNKPPPPSNKTHRLEIDLRS